MKTLKKTLCLVLAVVMAVGVLILPANAADAEGKKQYEGFQDTDKINGNYKTAVATLTGMGIIKGTSDVNFTPGETLKRQMAAVLVVNVMLNEGERDAALTGYSDQFTDINGTDTYAKKQINYLAANGIVSGVGDGKFNPNGILSTYQLLTMLMRVAEKMNGYKPANSGEWKADAVKFATDYGVYGDAALKTVFAGNLDNAPTREETCQIIWDVMNHGTGSTETGTYAVTVTTWTSNESSSSVTSKGVSFEAALMMKLAYEKNAKTEDDKTGLVTVEIVPENTVNESLGYKTYGLVKNDTTVDKYGRPTTTYTNNLTGKQQKVYSVINYDPIVAPDTDGMTQAEIFKAFDVEDTLKPVVLYVNGQVTAKTELDQYGLHKDLRWKANYEIDLTQEHTGANPFAVGRGTIVELYERGGINYVVVIPTYVTTIAGDYKDDKKVEYWVLDEGVLVKKDDNPTLAKGSVVVYTRGVENNAVVAEAHLAEKVTSIITQKSTGADKYIYVSGALTRFSEMNTVDDDLLVLDGKTERVFYFDNYGNIIHATAVGSDAPATVANYMYVLQYKEQNAHTELLGSSTEAGAAAVVLDPLTGAVSVINLAIAQSTDAYWYIAKADGTPDTSAKLGDTATNRYTGMVSFTKINDKYVLTPVASVDKSLYVGNSLTIGKGSAKITYDTNKTLYANASTSLVVVTYAGGKVSGSAVSKTGYSSFAAVTLPSSVTDGQIAQTLIEYKNGVASRIFVIMPPQSGSETTTPTQRAIFVKTGDQTLTGTPYTFIIDGKEVVVNSKNAALAGTHKNGDFVSITVDGSGLLTAIGEADSTNKKTGIIDTVSDGYILITGEAEPLYITDKTIVYDADASAGVGLGATMAKDNKITYYVDSETNALLIVVITAHK